MNKNSFCRLKQIHKYPFYQRKRIFYLHGKRFHSKRTAPLAIPQAVNHNNDLNEKDTDTAHSTSTSTI